MQAWDGHRGFSSPFSAWILHLSSKSQNLVLLVTTIVERFASGVCVSGALGIPLERWIKPGDLQLCCKRRSLVQKEETREEENEARRSPSIVEGAGSRYFRKTRM